MRMEMAKRNGGASLHSRRFEREGISDFGIRIAIDTGERIRPAPAGIRSPQSAVRTPQSVFVRGFTLIELLLVLVILAVLAGLVVPRFAHRGEEARVTAAGVDVKSIEDAVDTFRLDNGRLPTSEEGLGALLQAPGNVRNWQGPYLKKDLPKDPWGNPYQYRAPGQHNPDDFDVWSYGPDGADGGGDDIGNWAQK